MMITSMNNSFFTHYMLSYYKRYVSWVVTILERSRHVKRYSDMCRFWLHKVSRLKLGLTK